MALSDIVDAITPPWAKKRPWTWALFRWMAVSLDAFTEVVFQGFKAGLPNAVDVPGCPAWGGFESNVETLAMIARDENVLQGLMENPLDLAYRLRHAQDADQGGYPAGGVRQMLAQLAGILGPTPPLMRIVNGHGDWWTRFQDGHLEYMTVTGLGVTYFLDGSTMPCLIPAQPWDWDSATVPAPPDQNYAGRWWLILYAPLNTPYGTLILPWTCNSGMVCGCNWNAIQTGNPSYPGAVYPWGATCGTNSPSALVSLVTFLVSQRQSCGFNNNQIIIAGDPLSFAPDGSSVIQAGDTVSRSAYPDGTWGQDTIWLSSNEQVPSRLASAVYWLGPQNAPD